MLGELRQLEQYLAGVAAAAERLRKTPTIALDIAPSDKALKDFFLRNRGGQALDAIKRRS